MIRFIPAFVSAVTAALATGMAFRARLPWLACGFLAVQSAFAFCAWWNLCRPEVFESRGYRLFFGAVFGLVLAVAVFLAASWQENFWVDVLLFPALTAALFLVGLALAAPRNQRVTMVQGGVLLFCGILGFIARSHAETPEMKIVTAALAFFWGLLGAFFWAYAVAKDAWTLPNLLIPSFVGIVCFSWMAWQLNGLQRERVLESATEIVCEVTT